MVLQIAHVQVSFICFVVCLDFDHLKPVHIQTIWSGLRMSVNLDILKKEYK
jgi:hypothetical protein